MEKFEILTKTNENLGSFIQIKYKTKKNRKNFLYYY